MKRTFLYPISLLLLASGCSSAPPDGTRSAELAEKLVSCQNERGALKEKLAGAAADLAKAQGQSSCAEPGVTADAPAAARRAGRVLPRRPGGPARDVIAAHPTLRGNENPAAEARTAQDVAEKLKLGNGGFRPCYEKGLKRNSSLQFVSQVKVRLTVTPDGMPRDVHLTPKTESEMETCIAQVIRRWHFTPYIGQPVVVEVPMSLKVQDH